MSYKNNNKINNILRKKKIVLEKLIDSKKLHRLKNNDINKIIGTIKETLRFVVVYLHPPKWLSNFQNVIQEPPKSIPILVSDPVPEPEQVVSEPITEPEPDPEPEPITEPEQVVSEPITEPEPEPEPEPITEPEPEIDDIKYHTHFHNGHEHTHHHDEDQPGHHHHDHEFSNIEPEAEVDEPKVDEPKVDEPKVDEPKWSLFIGNYIDKPNEQLQNEDSDDKLIFYKN